MLLLLPGSLRRLSLWSCLSLLIGPVAMMAGTSAFPQPAGHWHTSAGQILDSEGKSVRIGGVNWYGFETTDEVAHGLTSQDYHAILSDIKNLGYNTVRIPYSNQMVEHPIIPTTIS